MRLRKIKAGRRWPNPRPTSDSSKRPGPLIGSQPASSLAPASPVPRVRFPSLGTVPRRKVGWTNRYEKRPGHQSPGLLCSLMDKDVFGALACVAASVRVTEERFVADCAEPAHRRWTPVERPLPEHGYRESRRSGSRTLARGLIVGKGECVANGPLPDRYAYGVVASLCALDGATNNHPALRAQRHFLHVDFTCGLRHSDRRKDGRGQQ